MKAILEFNLDEQEDSDAHYRCINSLDMALTLYDLDNTLRALLKHEDMEDKEYDRVEKLRDFLYETMNQRGLSFDRLLR